MVRSPGRVGAFTIRSQQTPVDGFGRLTGALPGALMLHMLAGIVAERLRQMLVIEQPDAGRSKGLDVVVGHDEAALAVLEHFGRPRECYHSLACGHVVEQLLRDTRTARAWVESNVRLAKTP